MSVHILSPCLEDPCVDMKSGNQQLGPLVLLSLREKLLSGTAVKLDEESIPGWFTVAYKLSPTTFSVQGWVEGMLVTDGSGWTAGDPLLWVFLLWRHSITTDSITGKAAAMHSFTRAWVCLTSLACCFSSLRTGKH